ncbi:MAG: RodZ domain-containing protein [Alphaproteobacteria bacterium]
MKKETKEVKETEGVKVEKNVSQPIEEVTKVIKVGDLISEARKAKKLDISEVSEKLRIRRIYLEAIENNDYETLPSFPYGVGFVRSYADFLGLDGSSLADVYKKETNLKEKTNLRVIDSGDIVNDSTIPSQTYLVLSIVAVLVVYFGWLFINKYYAEAPAVDANEDVLTTEVPQTDFSLSVDEVVTNQEQPELQVIDTTVQNPTESSQITIETGNYEGTLPQQPAPTTVAPEVKVEPKAEEVKTKVQDSKTKITGQGVEVLIKKETWFEAKDGNKLYVSKEFKQGDYYKVPEFPNMIVSTGRPNSVEVYVNGKLTPVFTPYKKMNVNLDKFLDKAEH